MDNRDAITRRFYARLTTSDIFLFRPLPNAITYSRHVVTDSRYTESSI